MLVYLPALQGLARASVHPRDLTLHRPNSSADGSGADASASADSDAAEGYSLALKLHDFGAALAAATGGAYSSSDGDGVAGWLCTEQDPSYSAPEARKEEPLLLLAPISP